MALTRKYPDSVYVVTYISIFADNAIRKVLHDAVPELGTQTYTQPRKSGVVICHVGMSNCFYYITSSRYFPDSSVIPMRVP